MAVTRLIAADITDRSDGRLPAWSAGGSTHQYVDPGGGSASDVGSRFSGIDDRGQYAAEFGAAEGHDHEFDGAGIAAGTLPAGWSWVNQGAALYYQRFSHGRIDWGGGGGAVNIHAVVTSLPAGLQSCDIWMHLWGAQQDAVLDYDSNVVLRNSANGRLIHLGRHLTSAGTNLVSPQWFVNYYSSPTAFVSTQGSVRIFQAQAPHWYAHIVINSPSSVTFYTSPEAGCDFQVAANVNVSSLLDGPADQVGFGMSTRQPGHVGCEWIRIRDIVTS